MQDLLSNGPTLSSLYILSFPEGCDSTGVILSSPGFGRFARLHISNLDMRGLVSESGILEFQQGKHLLLYNMLISV